MQSLKRVAVVTGGNRGLGFEACRQLAAQDYHVILTSRDKHNGQEAVKTLGLKNITYHQLDVTDAESVLALRQFIVTDIGRVDVLINNAAINVEENKPILEASVAGLDETLETNLGGPLQLCQALVPLMIRQKYGRVVNVSSRAGQLSTMSNYSPLYAISKAALNALTRLVAAQVGASNVLVNSACPGWVRTDMGGPNAPGTVEQGADTIVWLATLPDGSPSGNFYAERKIIPW